MIEPFLGALYNSVISKRKEARFWPTCTHHLQEGEQRCPMFYDQQIFALSGSIWTSSILHFWDQAMAKKNSQTEYRKADEKVQNFVKEDLVCKTKKI